ncbi:phosphatidylethanolamine:Kdo2-lipid A phosphoethanolamine transferase [Pasteurella langaaensis DSM 22999]|uniref:Phosphatidylethanolamine:Kdo2-lipid A phosphoethanolamine transferase n=1 Tax=Alitibacter langaaensis DSM 22999 TaxID=1122935 RepID=A0A2U0TCH1_9PAST|nr:phosphoethanolamine--lipid A transferase [Pasteurella langaaensis]PVX41335.1 phosphatidylethanolamine:Kdo2-lipid A phosphoethanolamine transferase [Pasteurella langaaensis DSM 22999]
MSISLPRWKMSSIKLNLLLSLYFTLVLNLAFFRQVFLLSGPTDYFLLTTPLVLFVACNIVFNILSVPFLHKIIIPLFLLVSAAVSYNSLVFNVYFDRDMLTNVLQTNLAESSRMLSFSYIAWLLILGVLPTILYLCVKVDYKKWTTELFARIASILVSALFIFAVGTMFYQDYASFFRNNKYLPHLLVPSNFVAASISKIKHARMENMPFVQTGIDAKMEKTDNNVNVSVIVVGETTRAQNWGLNGYTRQTTPNLAARIKRGENLINFTDVSSCGTATAISVPCMFSSLTRANYDAAQADHQDNLLDTLQYAGVNVQWIDNDAGCKDVCNRVPTINTLDLQVPEYCNDGECLDNIMLPELKKLLANVKQDTLIVLHTIGSHGPTYFERYSEKERQFTPDCTTKEINHCSRDELVNTYDNGVLYIDQFLDKVISQLETHPEWKTSMLYVSDHGESLGESNMYMHAAPYAIAPKEQTQVPMVMWFSQKWAENKPVDLNCLRQNANNAYSHDNIFHSVFSLMDMKMSSLKEYRKELDILAACRK